MYSQENIVCLFYFIYFFQKKKCDIFCFIYKGKEIGLKNDQLKILVVKYFLQLYKLVQ